MQDSNGTPSTEAVSLSGATIFPPPPVAAPAPGQPAPVVEEPPAARWLVVPGFLVLTGCFLAGEWCKGKFGLVLPGNILGLFLLLALLLTGVVPLRWVEGAARVLLWLLPFLFLPIFVLAMRDQGFWSVQGKALAGAVAIGTAALWAFVGHLSQWMLKRRMTRVRERSLPSDNDKG